MTKRDDVKNTKLLNICILTYFVTMTLSKFFGSCCVYHHSSNRYNRAIVIPSRL
jgi:hypothetical protein